MFKPLLAIIYECYILHLVHTGGGTYRFITNTTIYTGKMKILDKIKDLKTGINLLGEDSKVLLKNTDNKKYANHDLDYITKCVDHMFF